GSVRNITGTAELVGCFGWRQPGVPPPSLFRAGTSVSPGVRRLGPAWDRAAMARRALRQYGSRLARLEDLPRGIRLRYTSDRVGEDRPRNPRRSCECQKMKGQIM